jgi:hypothetical protein
MSPLPLQIDEEDCIFFVGTTNIFNYCQQDISLIKCKTLIESNCSFWQHSNFARQMNKIWGETVTVN